MNDPAWLHRFGSGPMRAVALHCMLARGHAWAGVANRLAPSVQVVAPDWVGHGVAPNWDRSMPLADACAAQVAPVLAAEAPCVLIGHSFGGAMALRLALAAPELVRALILIEPVWFFAARGGTGYAANAAHFAKVEADLARAGADAGLMTFLSAWGDVETLGPRQRSEMAARMPLVVASEHGLLNTAIPGSAEGGLESFDRPVLLIEGAESPPVVAEIQSALEARMKEVQRIVVPGAAHMVPVSHAAAVADAINPFLVALADR